MNKFLLTLSVLFLSVTQIFAKPVPANVAREVATAFYENNTSAATKTHPDLTLAYTCTSTATSSIALLAPVNYYYVFNASASQGFVIVSADDATLPVLGYATEGTFDGSKIPSNVQKWLEGYKNQIRYVMDHNLAPTDEITALWQDLSNGRGMKKTSASVDPLVKTKWNQSPYYNDLCPYDNNEGKLSVTGCVATAMAQVLRYWSWPEQGSGFHSYNHEKYGTLSASFGNTAYNWAGMPTSISSSNKEIATVMYHCGVAVDMSYSPESSGAWVIKADDADCAESALTNYFGYDPATVKGLNRSDYTDSKWLSMMKDELDNSRPIIYDGFGSGGGHCFVADGYDGNSYLHFNWGWGGYYDGYFEMSALNPGGVGTGGGTGGYNNNQQAVIGIKPTGNNGGGGGGGGGTTTASISLNDYVTVSSSSIYYGQQFTVHCDVVNSGDNTFKGQYCAAIFDEDMNFVDFVSTLTETNGLPATYHYTNGLDFTTTGLLSMLPGKYYAAVFYKEDNGNWVAVADVDDYVNLVEIDVINPADIEMYAAMSIPNDATLTRGDALSVKLDVANYSSNDFTGTFDLSLYGLDGKFVATIQTLSNFNLSANSHYVNGLTFKTSKLDVEPGTYLMAVLYKSLTGDWQLAGSSYYQNPIKVIVQEAAIVTDSYEPNNTSTAAYKFTPSFNGTHAEVTTSNANVNNGSDYDYYKIHLTPGSSYKIDARLYDKGNQNGGNYTLDALVSYSMDGNKWSDAYDDNIDGTINMPNGGDLYFLVAPYFAGNAGSYQLSMDIEKEQGNDVKTETASVLKVYPNPVKDVLTLSLAAAMDNNAVVRIEDLSGKTIWTGQMMKGEKQMQVNTSTLSQGMYMIILDSQDGILRQKFTVCD
jgi:hypothetical protein